MTRESLAGQTLTARGEALLAAQGERRFGRYGIVFAAIWLIWLGQPLQEAWALRDGPRGWVGIVATVAFGATYCCAFAWVRHRRHVEGRLRGLVPWRYAAAWLTSLFALGLVMVLAVGQDGLAACVYLSVAGVMFLPIRGAAALTLALAAAVEVSSSTVAGWTNGVGLSLSICVAAFAMWGVMQLMNRNLELVRAREENARLAVEDERNRLARDLHDILGHSLTVITVKAELAGRLMEVDHARARAEVADLERLSRDALADVRRAVEGYREMSLAGELARAREALRAAEIEADLPNSTEIVPTDLREVFAWAVREGVTNVIRHSNARRCTVRLTAERVDVLDDGTGPCPEPGGGGNGSGNGSGSGHGLVGLGERASGVGAHLITKTVQPQGFSLSVVAGGAA